jgi:hypothetical protein
MVMALYRIRNDVLALCILVICGRKAPALFTHVPVYRREGDDVLQPLQLPGN